MTLKPIQIHLSSLVNESSHQTFLIFTKLHRFDVDDFTNNLYLGGGALQFIDFVITCTVNVAIGVKIDQISILMNPLFFAKQCPTSGANAF